MFKKVFSKKDNSSSYSSQPSFQSRQKQQQNSQDQTFSTIQRLEQQSQMLETRKEYIEKQIDNEMNKARQLVQAGKKSQAQTAITRKKMLEQQSKQLDNQILRINESLLNLQGARSTLEAVSSMRASSQATKSIMKEMNINQIDNVIDEINETNDELRQVNEALEQPVGATIDQTELEDELAELTEQVNMESKQQEVVDPRLQQLQQNKVPQQQLSANLGLPSVPKKQQQTVEDELEELQASLEAAPRQRA